MIYTFYSYKGGVGRSMALANIAEWLYRKGLRVIMIDWDLEAPGLENFFYSSEEELERVRSQLGLIDLLASYKRYFPLLPLASSEGSDIVTLLRDNLPLISHMLYPIRGGNNALDGTDPALFLLPAGWRSGDRFVAYAQAVQSFDWNEFYTLYEGKAFFEWLRAQLLDDGFADAVLIDSRTGVIEMGGVCSPQLADVVVAFCVPNIHALRSTEAMVKAFKQDEALQVRKSRSLDMVVVPTRVEESGLEARKVFEEEFRKLDLFTPEAFKQSSVTFWDLRVPYVAKYAYSETLAVTSGDPKDELASAYHTLAVHLARLAPEGSRMREVLAEDIKLIEQRYPQSDATTLTDPSTVASDAVIAKDAAITMARVYPSVTAEPLQPPFMAPQLPSSFVSRSTELEKVIAEMVERQPDDSDALVVGIHGAGGSGKSVLATAVCYDTRVREAFPDGVLWVTLGVDPGSLTGQIEDCITKLTGWWPGITNIEVAATLLAEVLDKYAVLLVIDDVRNAAHLEPFLRGGLRCARLLTARNSAILPDGCIPVRLDTMRPQESAALLGASLPAGHEQELHTMAARLGGWPLPLTLANGMLTQQIDSGKTPVEALHYLNNALQRHDLEAFDTDRTVEPLLGTAQAPGASLELLDEKERARYEELSIFVEGVDIPLNVVGKFWSVTGGLGSSETEGLCIRLDQMSLLQFNRTTRKVQLHPVLRSHLVQQQSSNLLALHRQLLDAYRPESPNTWADLSGEEEYLWDNLSYHLVEAERVDELVETVKDVRYLTTKAFNRGALAAEQDLLTAEAHAPHRDRVLTALRRNFVNATHLLNQCKTLQDAVGTLHSRIVHLPILEKAAFAAEAKLAYPFITARHPLPDLPDPFLSRTLLGHLDEVWGCAISADGSLIASASADSTIKVWDALRGAELVTLTEHSGPVTRCAVSVDKDKTRAIIASASEDCTLKIWKCPISRDKTGAITVSALRGDIRKVEAAGNSGERTSSEQTTFLCTTLAGHTAAVSDCDINSHKGLIVSASEDHTLKLWEASTGEELRAFLGHTARVKGCAISSDGSLIISASLDGTLKVWDTEDGTETKTLKGHRAGVRDCAISDDGSIAVSASRDNTLKVWDVQRGIPTRTLVSHTAGVNGCAISADGTVIVSAGRDRVLKVWDAASGTETKTLIGHSDWVTDCAISEDGSVIVSASEDQTLKIWDVHDDIVRPRANQHMVEVNDLSVSADGALIVCASTDKTLTIWDARNGSKQQTLTGHSAPVLDCAISPTSKFIISASSDSTLKVWDTATGTSLRTLYGHDGGIRSCAISPDEKIIVSASADNTLKLWDLHTGYLLRTLAGHRADVLACAISSDGSRVVSASDDQTLKVWDIASAIELMTLEGHTGWVLNCAISPDGRLIASASADGTLKIWDASSGAELRTLNGHRAGVFGCAFSPDGKWIVSASGDNSLRVWEASNGEPLAALHVDGRLSACAWHPDGEQITAVGNRGIYFLRLVL